MLFVEKDYDVYEEEFCKIVDYDIHYNKIVVENNKKNIDTENINKIIKYIMEYNYCDGSGCINKYNKYIDEYNNINKDKLLLNKLISVESKKNKINTIEDEIRKFKLYTTEDDENIHVLAKINNNKKLFIWIDGLNASFTHYHVTKELPDLDMVSIDLRHCGRSKTNTMVPHYSADFKEYFEEIDAVLDHFEYKKYEQVILYGHSTGGLIVTLYMSSKGEEVGYENFRVILNSPFFDIYKPDQPYLLYLLKYLVYFMSRYICYYLDKYMAMGFQFIKLVKGGSINHYVLVKNRNYYINGIISSAYDIPITLGFLTNVIRYQSLIHKGNVKLKCPTLVLHSNETDIDSDKLQKCGCNVDSVLNIEDIKKYSAIISCSDNIKICEINNGCHDVLLSALPVVKNVVQIIKNFIN